MTHMELVLNPLRLKVELQDRQTEVKGMPFFDWLRCRVTASVPGFQSDIEWSVMPSELTSLAEQLTSLHKQFPKSGKVSFDPMEPNLKIDFILNGDGTVDGSFTIVHDTLDDTSLSGSFAVDQSYLPDYSKAIRAFLKESEPKGCSAEIE